MRLRRRNTISFCTLLGLAVAPAHEAWGNQTNGHLRGSVIDSRDKTPIANAEISFVQVDFVTQTNQEGHFHFENIPVGRYTLLVRIVGFKPVLASSQMILPDTTTTLNVELEPNITELEGISVVGNETTKSSTYTTNVLTSEDLPDRGDVLEAIEAKVPGLRLTTRTSISGSELRDQRSATLRNTDRDVLFVVDGTVITPPLTYVIPAAEVLCVEIRRGSAAALEYNRWIVTGRNTNYSGVIIIWTLGSRAPINEDCLQN